MKRNLFNNLSGRQKLNTKVAAMSRITVLLIFISMGQFAHSQVRQVILKITDPAPVCVPATVDLTSSAITSGSTEGLRYSYYANQELTIALSDPTKVGKGIYYIKGVQTVSMGTYAAASVEVFVLDKPKVVIPNPIIKSVAGIADLTLSEVTSGSDTGLSFSYWTDAAAKELVTAPKSVTNGNYFIKGTAANGCYDVKQVTVE